MEKINLKEILANKSADYKLALEHGREDYITIKASYAIEAMKEAIKQAIELASENVEDIERMGRDANPECFVDTQSILNVINLID